MPGTHAALPFLAGLAFAGRGLRTVGHFLAAHAARFLAAVAQLERATIRERQAEGIAIAKRNGVYDRGPKLTPEQIEDARQRVAAGVAKAKVARDLGVSRQTLYAALSGTGKYAEPVGAEA